MAQWLHCLIELLCADVLHRFEDVWKISLAVFTTIWDWHTQQRMLIKNVFVLLKVAFNNTNLFLSAFSDILFDRAQIIVKYTKSVHCWL